jgi:Protein of unknown function (DUF2961)
MTSFNGLGVHLGNLSLLSDAETRSISPENFTGARGAGGRATTGTGADAGRELGRGWKISPSVNINPGSTFTMADIRGAGAIQQIWLTPTGSWRHLIFRCYWDGQTQPSVEVPIGDFFGMGWGEYAALNSLAICVNPGSGFNSYWEMPFRSAAKLTVENISAEPVVLYYQVSYALTDVPADCAYFHAQFRRTNPLPYKTDYTILDGVSGRGHYIGTYLAWGTHNRGWWGEGEVKMFLDDDADFPTICGTGTEDYFCGSYGFIVKGDETGYRAFTTAYAGFHQVIRPSGRFGSQTRFGMYRWHIPDPVRFKSRIKVTVQALGWRSGRRYLPLQDDIASVAFWYQTLPSPPPVRLPNKDELEVI